MSAVVADTHVAIWYLFEPTRLSPRADAALSAAVGSGSVVHVSVTSLIEVRYLIEKGRLPVGAWDDLMAALDDASVPLEPVAIDVHVARALNRIPRTAIPDLPDRVIAATALALSVPLVTADRRIRASTVPTIW